MRVVTMASSTHPFAAGLATVFVAALAVAVGGCAAEDSDQQAKFPRAPGSDAFQGMMAEDGQEPPAEALVAPDGAAVGPDGQADPVGDSYADTDPSALTDFHSTLDPHGQWIEDPNYGTMWQPAEAEVGSDFAPYVSGGHWGYDDANENVWMSDYGWGWAPFHYGRWAYGGSGWGWIPGRQYAPAWVSWRTGYPGFGYVGWAPMAPSWYWGAGGMAFGLGVVPPTPYAFCGVHDLYAPSGLQGRVVSNPTQMQAIAGQTHSYTASGGPSGGGSPSSGGRVPAHPSVAGPSPQSLHLANSEVTHVASNNPQLAHATQFARPSSAVTMGARPPASSSLANASHVVHGTGGTLPGGAVAGHAQIARPSMPAYGGGTAHSYYNNSPAAHATGTGESYYGHGGTYRSYGAPSAPGATGGAGAHGGVAVHPTTQYVPQYAVPHPATTSGSRSAHFGGHYGGGAHGGGGGHR
jgi:hypothetical protein